MRVRLVLSQALERDNEMALTSSGANIVMILKING